MSIASRAQLRYTQLSDTHDVKGGRVEGRDLSIVAEQKREHMEMIVVAQNDSSSSNSSSRSSSHSAAGLNSARCRIDEPTNFGHTPSTDSTLCQELNSAIHRSIQPTVCWKCRELLAERGQDCCARSLPSLS
ncbi:unnamed protein product [Gongylonema pulchrum]|uniref:Uncharacterized protein n=1 Tax=Gongylonema pulchrum TaxID=637853 RepID=A0A183DVT9_9BILA|nr:unnamed protein product [Gongylonema pulchrum]